MLENQVAIITGAAQGIGKATAKYFVERKCQVIIVDHDEKAGNETVKEYQAFGKIAFMKADVSQEADVKKVITSTLKKYGKINYLINNAGTFIKKPLGKLTFKEWNHIIGTNLSSAFLFSQLCAPYIRKTHGAIVNIASTRALMSEPNTEAYAASKGGIVALTHALALSLGDKIRVNCISPGWIETCEWQKRSKRHKPKHSRADLAQHPVGRVGRPEDVASLIGYLVSPQAEFITGANFVVDGGMTRKMIYD